VPALAAAPAGQAPRPARRRLVHPPNGRLSDSGLACRPAAGMHAGRRTTLWTASPRPSGAAPSPRAPRPRHGSRARGLAPRRAVAPIAPCRSSSPSRRAAARTSSPARWHRAPRSTSAAPPSSRPAPAQRR
jgi:hypothetical protein